MAADFSCLVPSAGSIRTMLIPIMEKRGIGAADSNLRDAILRIAIKEARGGAETLAWACNRKGMNRSAAARVIKDGIIMDLMSVLNRAEAGMIT